MKRVLCVFLALLMISLAGCTSEAPAENQEETLGDIEAFGAFLEVDNVTPTGLTLSCASAGGTPSGTLQTGERYVVQTLYNGRWKEVDTLREPIFTTQAIFVSEETPIIWEIDWQWLYGTLPNGQYRIGKEIMDYRQPGDFDIAWVYAEFTIEADS